MNDEFLTELREAPRREFSDGLYDKLAQQKADAPRIGALKIVATALLALALPLALTMMFSPAARAAVQGVIQKVGNLTFDVSDEYPGGDGPAGILESEEMTLEGARAAFPVALRVPAWVPDGYAREEPVSITHLPDGNMSALMTWLDDQNRLALHTYSSPQTLMREDGVAVGPGSVEEALVNGRPAAILHGAWNANTKTWGPDMLISLLWTDDERGYLLSGMEQHITPADLVRMAESME
jgi:hypothetical protein